MQENIQILICSLFLWLLDLHDDWLILRQRFIAHKILPDEITLRIRPDEDMKLDGEPSHATITIEVKYSVLFPNNTLIVVVLYSLSHDSHTEYYSHNSLFINSVI